MKSLSGDTLIKFGPEWLRNNNYVRDENSIGNNNNNYNNYVKSSNLSSIPIASSSLSCSSASTTSTSLVYNKNEGKFNETEMNLNESNKIINLRNSISQEKFCNRDNFTEKLNKISDCWRNNNCININNNTKNNQIEFNNNCTNNELYLKQFCNNSCGIPKKLLNLEEINKELIQETRKVNFNINLLDTKTINEIWKYPSAANQFVYKSDNNNNNLDSNNNNNIDYTKNSLNTSFAFKNNNTNNNNNNYNNKNNYYSYSKSTSSSVTTTNNNQDSISLLQSNEINDDIWKNNLKSIIQPKTNNINNYNNNNCNNNNNEELNCFFKNLNFNHNENIWCYLAQGYLQGPFNDVLMDSFYLSGYFGSNLCVRRIFDERFITLGELIKLCGNTVRPFLASKCLPNLGYLPFTNKKIDLLSQEPFKRCNIADDEKYNNMPSYIETDIKTSKNFSKLYQMASSSFWNMSDQQKICLNQEMSRLFYENYLKKQKTTCHEEINSNCNELLMNKFDNFTNNIIVDLKKQNGKLINDNNIKENECLTIIDKNGNQQYNEMKSNSLLMKDFKEKQQQQSLKMNENQSLLLGNCINNEWNCSNKLNNSLTDVFENNHRQLCSTLPKDADIILQLQSNLNKLKIRTEDEILAEQFQQHQRQKINLFSTITVADDVSDQLNRISQEHFQYQNQDLENSQEQRLKNIERDIQTLFETEKNFLFRGNNSLYRNETQHNNIKQSAFKWNVKPLPVKSIKEIQAEEASKKTESKNDNDKNINNKNYYNNNPNNNNNNGKTEVATNFKWNGKSLIVTNHSVLGTWNHRRLGENNVGGGDGAVGGVVRNEDTNGSSYCQNDFKNISNNNVIKSNNKHIKNLHKTVEIKLDFYKECQDLLQQLEVNISVDEFVTTLETCETANEIKGYVYKKIGKNEFSKNFLREYFQKRYEIINNSFNKKAEKKKFLDKVNQKNKIYKPNTKQQLINRKNKKQRSKEIRCTIEETSKLLGFSVTAAQDRIHIGELELV